METVDATAQGMGSEMKDTERIHTLDNPEKSGLALASELGIVNLIRLMGDEVDREGMKETPERFVKAMRELTGGYADDPATILSKCFNEPYNEMVVVSGIDFVSLCEHHLLPFTGTVSVAYLPDGKVVGLSKLPRLVQCYARRLQIQERMTIQIADAIDVNLQPKGVGVVVQATHTCMKFRGVKSNGEMKTSCLRGAMAKEGTRNEFFRLAGH